MAQRRERPSVQQAGDSLVVRLPDGTVKTMPIDARPGGATSDVCCFCGQTVDSDREGVQLSVRWSEDGTELRQAWAAHRDCLATRMHERVAGTGPFFGDSAA